MSPRSTLTFTRTFGGLHSTTFRSAQVFAAAQSRRRNVQAAGVSEGAPNADASGAKGTPCLAAAMANSGEKPAPDGTSGLREHVARMRALLFAARAATSLCASKRT